MTVDLEALFGESVKATPIRQQAVVVQQLLMQPKRAVDLEALFAEPQRVTVVQQTVPAGGRRGTQAASVAEGLALFKRIGKRYWRSLQKKIPPWSVGSPRLGVRLEPDLLVVGCTLDDELYVSDGSIAFPGQNELVEKARRKRGMLPLCSLVSPTSARARAQSSELRRAFPPRNLAFARDIPVSTPADPVRAGIAMVEMTQVHPHRRPTSLGPWLVRVGLTPGKPLPGGFDGVLLAAAAFGAGRGSWDRVEIMADPDRGPLDPLWLRSPAGWAVTMPLREG